MGGIKFRKRMEKNKASIPVRVGDILDLEIVAIGEKGDGIAKIEGFVIIIPKTKEGETYKVEITKVLNNVAFGVAV